MNLKPTLLAASLAVACGAMALAPTAFAADGTITINGKVLNSTCTATVSSGAGSTVTLPDTVYSALTANTGVNPVAFSIMLTGCPTTPGGVQVGAVFDGTNADTVNTNKGLLTNTAVSGATNVDIQVMSTGGTAGTTSATATSGGSVVAFDGSTVTDQVVPDSTGNAVLGYYAQYYATAALTSSDAGAVQTSSTFTINYQ